MNRETAKDDEERREEQPSDTPPAVNETQDPSSHNVVNHNQHTDSAQLARQPQGNTHEVESVKEAAHEDDSSTVDYGTLDIELEKMEALRLQELLPDDDPDLTMERQQNDPPLSESTNETVVTDSSICKPHEMNEEQVDKGAKPSNQQLTTSEVERLDMVSPLGTNDVEGIGVAAVARGRIFLLVTITGSEALASSMHP